MQNKHMCLQHQDTLLVVADKVPGQSATLSGQVCQGPLPQFSPRPPTNFPVQSKTESGIGEGSGFLLCPAVCPTQLATGAKEQRGNRVWEVPTELGLGEQEPDQRYRAARSSWAHTWPHYPGARAGRGGVAEGSARLVKAGVPSQDSRGRRRDSPKPLCSSFISCPMPHTYPFCGAVRPCGVRYPYGRGACRVSGARGRRVRDPADWGSRPARRRLVR